MDYKAIGEDFLTYYWPALVAMALVLAGSITGALILARRHDGVEDEQRTD
uniref:NADH-ubiquinone oxidoreductase subunit J (NdhG) n=1 Tax=uncultured marine thaumarchaeote KM3_173_E01 TaxID=1456050 RepID=A0A075GMQ1_9ARCH|nr:NADH-ubiquinone oxidoreductase subunit J (ndhG) [uncultured marine thaumarchaeote KM3_173_E01]